MYDVSAQGVGERMTNVQYYYFKNMRPLGERIRTRWVLRTSLIEHIS